MPKRPSDLTQTAFMWDMESFFRDGVSNIMLNIQRKPSVKEGTRRIEKDLKRFNQHQATKGEISEKIAEKIQTSLDNKNSEKTQLSKEPKVVLTMVDQRRTTDDITCIDAIHTVRRHVQESQELVEENGFIKLGTMYTDAKPAHTMKLTNVNMYRQEQEKKRTIETIYRNSESEERVEPSGKKQMTFNSFKTTGIANFDQLVDEKTQFHKLHKKESKMDVKMFRYDQAVSASHIAKVLFAPYAEKQQVCTNAILGVCRVQLEPKLQHPCTQAPACMRYLSPVQWEAFEHDEEVSMTASPGDRQFFDSMCVFCYRYQLTREVAQDNTGTSKIDIEIANYYHAVDIIGEYDKSACLQPSGSNVSGILGPVVTYNVDNFRPVVGIRDGTKWGMKEILTPQEYENQKKKYENDTVVFGWKEVNVFFQLNSNALPAVTQISPYEIYTTSIKDGPMTIRYILQNYYRQRVVPGVTEKSHYGHVFTEFRDLINLPNLFRLPYPVLDTYNIQRMESAYQIKDVNATDKFQRYHAWTYICMHGLDNEPPFETHKIYYGFLYVVNAISHFQLDKVLPTSMQKKLKIYKKSFDKLKEHFSTTTDLSDNYLRTNRAYLEILHAECSLYFAFYPRSEKNYLVVFDYTYTTPEVHLYQNEHPDVELKRLYNQEIILPHCKELLDEAKSFEDLFPALMNAQSGAYQAVTDLYNKLLFNLCETMQFRWPLNSLTAFTPVSGTDDNVDPTELARRELLRSNAYTLIESMTNIFRELIHHLENENRQYYALRQNAHLLLVDYGDTVKWVRDMINYHGDAKRIFELLGISNFNHLIPTGFNADAKGVHTSDWSENMYLLAALVRVFIADRLRTLELKENTRERYLLLLLRNSHCDLVSMVFERGILVPIRDDIDLVSTAVIPSNCKVGSFGESYKSVLSRLAFAWPVATREKHEGMLPNMGNALMYANFFSELDGKPSYFFQRLWKHRNNLRPCAHEDVQKVFSKDGAVSLAKKMNKLKGKNKNKLSVDLGLDADIEKDTPKRNFALLLFEMSLKGLYEHCEAVPNFRCTMELNSVLSNGDVPEIREILDILFNTTIQRGEDKLKFEKILDDMALEFVHRQLCGNTALAEVIRSVYKIDLTAKSLASMDILRIVLNREHTLSLSKVMTIQQRLAVKVSQKLSNKRKLNNIQAICKVILASDEERYATYSTIQATLTPELQITADQKWMIETFVKHIDPIANIYSEELEIIGLTTESINCISRINNLQDGHDCAVPEAIKIFNDMDIHQSSIAAYFFEYLRCYIQYRPVYMTNKILYEQQEKILKRISRVKTVEELPDGVKTGLISICCSKWNGYPPDKQFMSKIVEENGNKKYMTTLGNQCVRKDPASGEILCGDMQNNFEKKKSGRKLVRNIEIDAGILPKDISSRFKTISRSYLNKFREKNNEEHPLRLVTQRRLETRVPDCARTGVLEVDLMGIALQCPQMKIPKQKKKDARKKSVDKTKTQDRNQLYPSTKASILGVSKPPFFIGACCGRIHGYKLNNWGANGYCCGGCMPASNVNRAMSDELLCASCLKVVPNRRPFNKCNAPECRIETSTERTKKRNKCKHGATPYLVNDDVYTHRITYQYFCDDCMKVFNSTGNRLEDDRTLLLSISSIKAQNTTFIDKITLEQ